MRSFQSSETLGAKTAINQPGSSQPDTLPNEVEVCLETARSVAAAGHAREAILLYEKAEQLSGEPKHRELAPLYAASGNTTKALERYREAVRYAQDDAELRNNLAWTPMEAGQLEESIEIARQGLLRQPNHPRLKTTSAVAEFKLGNRERAFELFRSVQGEAAAHHNIAMLEIDAGNESAANDRLAQAASHTDHAPETEQFRRALTR